MTSRRKAFIEKIEKYGALLGLISLILSIVTFPATFYFAYRADYLAQINSNFEPTVIPYIVEADLGRVNYNGSNVIDSDGLINLSLVVITPHAAILNFSKNSALDAVFPLRTMMVTVNGQLVPVLDTSEEFNNQMYRFSFNTSWALTFDPPVGERYVAFVQPGVTQLNFSFPIHGIFTLNPEYLNSLGHDFAQLLNLCDFKVNLTLLDVQTQQQLVKEYTGTVDVWFASNYPH